MNLNELEDIVVNELVNNNKLVKKIIMRKDVYDTFNKSMYPTICSKPEVDRGNIIKSHHFTGEIDIESSDSMVEEYKLDF